MVGKKLVELFNLKEVYEYLENFEQMKQNQRCITLCDR